MDTSPLERVLEEKCPFSHFPVVFDEAFFDTRTPFIFVRGGGGGVHTRVPASIPPAGALETPAARTLRLRVNLMSTNHLALYSGYTNRLSALHAVAM